MGEKARRGWRITGRVQGVGYRHFAYSQGNKLGLVGWVRNEPDGSVSAEAQGPIEALEAFEAKLRRGPMLSRVDRVAVEERLVVEETEGKMCVLH